MRGKEVQHIFHITNRPVQFLLWYNGSLRKWCWHFITNMRGLKLFIRKIAIVAQSCPSSAGFVLELGVEKDYSKSTFLGLKWHSPLGSMPFHRVQNVSISRAQPLPTCPRNGCCPHQKHYARGRINHSCIGGFMYKSPRVFSGPIPPLQCR